MIFHFISDSVYAKKYISFVNECFESSNHLFYINSSPNSRFAPFYASQENCQLFNSASIVIKEYLKISKSDKIIFHQLNQPRIMLFWLLFYPRVFRKLIWVIWGSDLYFYKYKTSSLKDRLIFKLFNVFIPRVKYVCTFLKGDYEICKEVYKSNPELIIGSYPYTIDWEFIEKFKFRAIDSNNVVKILLGNSASASNLHIDALNKLSKFSGENIELYLVLSYGGSIEYIQEVKKLGNQLFSDKIIFIENYLNTAEYDNFLSEMDICIFNNDIQEGLGNLKALTSIYKKVFVRKQTSTFEYYSSIGVKLYEADAIPNLSFAEFIFLDETTAVENSRKIIADNEDEKVKKEWENVFFKILK